MPTLAEDFQFSTMGFLVLRNVLSPAEVTEINGDLDRYLESAERHARPVRGQIHPRCAFLMSSAALRRLMDHEVIMPYLDAWIEPSFRFDHCYGVFTEPGQPQLPMHHGGAMPLYFASYRQIGTRILSGSTTVSWALTSLPSGGGTFTCVPGSHLATQDCPADVRTYRTNLDCVVEIPMEPGDVIIFTEAITHGARRWQAGYRRRTLLYKYAPGCMTWSSELWPDDFQALLTDRQRRLCRPPWAHDVHADGHGFRSAVLDGKRFPLLDG